MFYNRPRIVIAALKGGSGKTIFSLGLIAAWRQKGLPIAPFKKGPDFIDAGWLTFAAGRQCYNLDPFLMNEGQILESFLLYSNQAHISIIEGNRGLYDGLDLDGHFSTAELGKLLKSPVFIVLDVTMATRTMAAVIRGCQTFDPELEIAGVILNRVAGSRQENLIRKSIEKYCGIPIVGAVPKLKGNLFPERHMGLVPYHERGHAEKAISWAKRTVTENLDLDEIWKIANGAEGIFSDHQVQKPGSTAIVGGVPPRIGFVRDRAFWFYYPENLEKLKHLGADLVEIDAMGDRNLPQLDGLYIGGGFPETQAQALADNRRFRDDLREKIEEGLPVYAECGGLMYLGKGLVMEGKTYPMVGSLPIEFSLQKRPQGHGYTILKVDGSNPYYPIGHILKGHEFHYSKALVAEEKDLNFVFEVRRGYGVNGLRDGICKKNLLATFTHIHAGGNPIWGEGLYKAADEFRKVNKNFQ